MGEFYAKKEWVRLPKQAVFIGVSAIGVGLVTASECVFELFWCVLDLLWDEDRGEFILAQIMTTKEMANYLQLHQITICKLSKEGKIPAVRIGRVWRFDKEVIDQWIAKG